LPIAHSSFFFFPPPGSGGKSRPFGFTRKEDIESISITEAKNTVTMLLRGLKCWHSAYKQAVVLNNPSQVVYKAMSTEQFEVVQCWSAGIMEKLNAVMDAAYDKECQDDPKGMVALKKVGVVNEETGETFVVEGGTRQPVPDWAKTDDDTKIMEQGKHPWGIGLPKGHIYLDHLFVIAEKIRPNFIAALAELVAQNRPLGATPTDFPALAAAPLKTFDRSCDKIANDYTTDKQTGDPAASHLQDIVRATIECDVASSAVDIVGKLDGFATSDGKTTFTLRRIKNRFKLSKEEVRVYNGYRDLNANVFVTTTTDDGEYLEHVCEVQVTLDEIAAAKHEMHKFYGLVRALLYTELNLSKVQRGPQSVDLISLGWLEVTMPEGSTDDDRHRPC